jgi:hypothetical protein
MPADTNAHGTIFGGWVMAQVDVAGSIPRGGAPTARSSPSR